ncbi:MAG: hypothetical protein ACKPAD_02600 [Bacteroidota bacterium]
MISYNNITVRGKLLYRMFGWLLTSVWIITGVAFFLFNAFQGDYILDFLLFPLLFAAFFHLLFNFNKIKLNEQGLKIKYLDFDNKGILDKLKRIEIPLENIQELLIGKPWHIINTLKEQGLDYLLESKGRLKMNHFLCKTQPNVFIFLKNGEPIYFHWGYMSRKNIDKLLFHLQERGVKINDKRDLYFN